MNTELKVSKSATATMKPDNQNRESVHRIVDQILRMGDCEKCGRIAVLKVNFLGDPPPDLAKEGVISLERQGF